MPDREIQIALYGVQGWILDALARQWQRILQATLTDTRVTLVGGRPVPGADAYIHMVHAKTVLEPGARNLVYVTHIDRWWKASRLIGLAREGAEFVTQSRQTQALLDRYLGTRCAHCVVPRSIHFPPAPARPLVLGLFFRLYDDGRKSHPSIAELLRIASRHAGACELILYGAGLAQFASAYPAARVRASGNNFELAEYARLLKSCDFVLYFGKDEGAISVVDAAALGIPVLATDQGFHRDLKLAPGSRLFATAREIVEEVRGLCGALAAAPAQQEVPQIFAEPGILDTPRSRVSAWRLLAVPFVRNPFLQGPNLAQSSAHLWRFCWRHMRRLGRECLEKIYRAGEQALGERACRPLLGLISRWSPRTHARIYLGRCDGSRAPDARVLAAALENLKWHNIAAFERARHEGAVADPSAQMRDSV